MFTLKHYPAVGNIGDPIQSKTLSPGHLPALHAHLHADAGAQLHHPCGGAGEGAPIQQSQVTQHWVCRVLETLPFR